MSNTVRLYELYQTPGGRFSNRTDDYSDIRVAVAACSSNQAHDLARQEVLATTPDDPLGILWFAHRGESPDHRLFNGHRIWGDPLRHGAGKQAIVDWMKAVLSQPVTVGEK